ncbi:molybdopterin molybdenumtransferase MoeA [Rhodobacteraceae bacterium 2CG4]|uniref:Molybdopterin molybdenumtransferase n=1 Tax=Halovulum marinum TaxID=2662447 RepID=A0A6L5YWX4_9RHOB|nr:gephyrin-like molybdotransferase Glp [Halovulum marinum]MSU88362.1 molybdopterin molybdenumtransferase MoeA [Halovulum marinum]
MTVHESVASPGCGCDRRDMLPSLISIDEALARIAAHAAPAGQTGTVALDSAVGRVLARPVRSRSMAPAFDNAAMDGYAVATSALRGPGPWLLQVVARVPAGQPATTSVAGAVAARIFTGAPIPAGADAVVMQEDVVRDGEVIHLSRRPAPGLNIRPAGSDMAKGATVLDKGHRLGPGEIAACAAAGAGFLQVQRRLRVALLVTGDEVRHAGDARKPAQIWDVNTPMLTASLAAAGVEIVASAHGGDDPSGLVSQLSGMAARADLVITTGGISVGEEDHVKPALAALGGEILFSGVAIKPGKPVSFGRIGKASWLGLPGNPLAAFVTWQIFGIALIRGLSGEVAHARTRRHVVTATELRRKPGRCELRPATIAGFDAHGREIVRFEDATHSARVGRLPLADGLVFLPADAESLPIGALVEFQPFCRS